MRMSSTRVKADTRRRASTLGRTATSDGVGEESAPRAVVTFVVRIAVLIRVTSRVGRTRSHEISSTCGSVVLLNSVLRSRMSLAHSFIFLCGVLLKTLVPCLLRRRGPSADAGRSAAWCFKLDRACRVFECSMLGYFHVHVSPEMCTSGFTMCDSLNSFGTTHNYLLLSSARTLRQWRRRCFRKHCRQVFRSGSKSSLRRRLLLQLVAPFSDSFSF